MVLLLFAGEVDLFGRQDVTAASEYLTLALTAASLSATGRGEENVFIGKRREERFAGLGLDNLIIIDCDLNFARMDKIFLGEQQDHHQKQCYDQKDANA